MGSSQAADIAYIQASLGELEKYLSSQEIFKSIVSAGGHQIQQLTLGGLLLALTFAHSRAVSLEERTQVEQLDRELYSCRQRWRFAWEKKARKEFKSRLRQWGLYLNEVQSVPEEYAVYYRHEVRLRVMLALLAEDVESEDTDTLNTLDQMLKTWFVEGDFIWEAEISTAFPRDPFWYLWGKLSG